ncbi:hypothetical protein SAMN02799624_06015 [Paenibacillus sp. UNC496MF]|uniref:hypothetical protein n=1 Tax=Paenibacillus sp. UNC496MF TaxID=1502753 RepID=UPI0008F2AFC3|nr:hypothetical protein [Paenibacillus sp. UNC496MF]SFJ79993.1 hypothetical protein SAMN02799624_06015 [Paenibacillus sp. UNC496MF]
MTTNRPSPRLTALALRADGAAGPVAYPAAEPVAFTGRWAVIAQDDRAVSDSGEAACVPFAAGELRLDRPFARVRVFAAAGGRLKPVRAIAAGDPPEGKLVVTEADLATVAGFVIETDAG